MNSENVDTEPSLQMHTDVGGGAGYTFFLGGGGGRVHSAQGTTQFVDH